MPALHASVHLAAAVLVLSGIAKLRSPNPLRTSLRALHLPSTAAAARTIGAVEAAVGVAVLVTGQRAAVAAMTAVWIGLLAAAASLMVRRAPDCGCFGNDGAPIGPGHLAVNVVATVAGAACLIGAEPVPTAIGIPGTTPVLTAAYAVLLVAGAGAVAGILTLWPVHQRTRRRVA